MDVNARSLSDSTFKLAQKKIQSRWWLILSLSLLGINPMKEVLGEKQELSSTATVEVYRSKLSPSGNLRFSPQMATEAKITFSPLKVTDRKMPQSVRQLEAQTSNSQVRLVDTRKNHTHPSNYVVEAKVSDGPFGTQGLANNQMTITMKPTSETFQVNNLRVVTLSEKVQPIFDVLYQNESIVPLAVNLNPVLESEKFTSLDLQPGQTKVYGAQIFWTLTPKI